MSRRVVLGVWCALVLMAACSDGSGVRPLGAERADGSSTTASPVDGTTTTSSVPVGSSTTTTTTGPVDPGVEPGEGVGDELFPQLGYTGIDVQHYDVAVRYDPVADAIEGVVAVTLRATAALPSFTLDAVGLDVQRVLVGDAEVGYRTTATELEITPSVPLAAGDVATVQITYTAQPNAGAASVGIPNGWFHTLDGSYVLNEPDGARTWMPCNDHPADKATFTFAVTVPAGMTAVANGGLVAHETLPDGEVWRWEVADPMATYLVLLLTGEYEVRESVTPDGLPLLSVAVAGEAASLPAYDDVTGQQIAFFEQFFGPYPFDRYGVAITDSFGGLAMETQERSLFSREDLGGSLGYWEHLLLAHELAHQWFGDSVTPARWIDIWLNESFATYGEWLWLEEAGFGTVDDAAELALQNRPSGASATPSAEELFSYNSYQGGAVVLHALRRTVGDEAFFETLRRWAQDNAGTSRTTADFIALASDVAGEDLAAFFEEWLFATPPAVFPPAQ